MAATSEEKGLEKVLPPKTPDVIRTPEEFRGALLRWQEQKLNVLTPFTNISGLAPHHGILSSSVLLNLDREAGEVYDGLPWQKKGEFSVAKKGLRKLAECAGISTQTFRTDPRTIRNYWEFKAIASYRGVDGSIVTREATKEWDLRDGSPVMKGWTPNQIEEARKNGLRNCEARAINAAIRECGCGIAQKYTRDQLAKPFAIVRVAFLPDMSDPDIKRMVTERALGGTTSLYAPQAGLPAPSFERPEVEDGPDDARRGEPRSVGSGSTVRGTASSSASVPPPVDSDPPPTSHAVRIKDVTSTSGKNPDTKRDWTKYSITDSNGVVHTTFSRTLSEDAARFRDANTWVEIDDEDTEDGRYSNIVQIQPAQPDLPLTGTDGSM